LGFQEKEQRCGERVKRRENKLPRQTWIPVLVFPLVFGLLYGYTMLYERNPRHMFKVFVADPIPAGVTDIQATDTSGGFDQEVVIVFNAPPAVMDAIIQKQKLVKSAALLYRPVG
jgi:hypothetical protein